MQSTKKNKIEENNKEEDKVMNPALHQDNDQQTNHLFFFAVIADINNNTVYMDNTGKFPVQSFEGHMYLFVLYDYTTNVILVEPL